jgi:transcriptional regulator with XRE-family HTH domain
MGGHWPCIVRPPEIGRRLTPSLGLNEISRSTGKPASPGERLKHVRAQLGITTREVALFSRLIAEAEGNNEFLISGPWLTQIENEKTSLPSIYKLFTLASIYGLSYARLLALYGVDVAKIKTFHARIPIAKTHLAQQEADENVSTALELPVRFDPGLNLSKTNLLSRMIESWGKVPLELIQHLDLRHRLYGLIGFSDYTLYPLLRPGSFVEIDPELKNVAQRSMRSEFDRPIYFIDLRNEYACSWCEVFEDKLLLLAHPLSPVKSRSVAFPRDAEIIGQVTGVAMRIGVSLPEALEKTSGAPSQS